MSTIVPGILQQVMHRDLFIVLSLILLCVLAVSKVAFPKLFTESMGFDKLFGFRQKEDLGMSIRPFSTEHIYFTAVYSFNLSFVLLFVINRFFPSQSGSELLQISGFWHGLLLWLVIGVLINLMVYLKYLLISLISWLFNARPLTSRHFIDLVNASSLFFILVTVLLSLSTYASFIPGELFTKIMTGGILCFFFYRSLLLYIRLLQLSPYSKLYIFSYICTTELIPLLIGLRFVII